MSRGGHAPPGAAAGLYLLTGTTALLYQVLWTRELGLVFGGGGEAAAATLAAFFLGLALGGAWWGRRAPGLARPLRAFGWLEVGVSLLALGALGLVPLYREVLVPALGLLEAPSGLRLLARLLLAGLVVGPPAFLMGGTLPVLGEHAVRSGRSLPGAGSLLYALNTLGAAAGALAGGALLPRALGYRGTYLVALGLGTLAGGLAVWLGRVAPPSGGRGGRTPPEAAGAPLRVPVAPPGAGAGLLGAVALYSGLATLALEVLLTRMFAQALQNSLYTFAVLLAVFLVALAAGAGGAHLLVRARLPAGPTLRALLLLSGVAAALGPWWFAERVPPPRAFVLREDFAAYLTEVGRHVAEVAGPLAFLLGLVFPFLLRAESERRPGLARAAPGRLLGRLLALNTLGALLGALLGGFVLPGLVGTWAAAAALGLGYFGLALRPARTPRAWALNAGVALLGGLTVAVARAQPRAEAVWTLRPGERVLARYEGSAGSVAVVELGADLKLRLNSSYTLGGTSEPRWERLQTHIPLSLHPAPRRVLYLGLGTGITAGAALDHPVERVRVAEIVPEVVQAAREHFAPFARGLFAHPAVEVLEEDARTVLAADPGPYDAVIGDLFLPWKRGTGLLFTVEHFEGVRRRLAPGGVFAQWLPLYQLGREEFHSVVRSFLEVFPRAALLRGDFFARRPVAALLARADAAPIDAAAVEARWRALAQAGALEEAEGLTALPFLFYAGALRRGHGPFGAAPLSTDDHPWVEFQAPRSQRARAAGSAGAFVGAQWLALQRELYAALPPEADPWWAGAGRARHRALHAGLALYAYAEADARGEAGRADRRTALADLLRLLPAADRPPLGAWVR